MKDNWIKNKTVNKILFFLSIILLSTTIFAQQGKAQIPLYYPPAFFNPIYTFGYFPVIPPPIYPVRNAFALLPSSTTTALLLGGGGISTSTLLLLGLL